MWNEGGHDPCNMQVVYEEYSSEAAFVLWDEDGEFLSDPIQSSNLHKLLNTSHCLTVTLFYVIKDVL